MKNYINKLCVSMFVMMACVLSFMGSVKAIDYSAISPDTVMDENKLKIYKGDEGDEIAKAIKAQKISVSETNAKVTNVNVNNDTKIGTGFLVSTNTTQLKKGVNWTFIDAQSYSVLEFDNSSNDNKATINYPLVGTYDGKKIGCKVDVISMVNKPTTYTSKFDKTYPVFVFTNNIYNGFMNINVSETKLRYTFYYQDSKEDIKTDGYFLNVNSLNGPGDVYSDSGYGEWAYSDSASASYITKDSNIKIIKEGDGLKAIGASNDFTDNLGGKTFNRNSVTFKVEKPDFEITIGNTKQGSSYQQNAIWATVVSGSLTFNKPTNPVKTTSKVEVYKGEQFDYTIKQKINTLGVDATTSHYSSFIFKDTLPQQVKYLSLLVKNGEQDITNQGKIVYDDKTRLLTFTMNNDYLEKLELQGQTISFVVKVESLEDLEDGHQFNNTALININDVELKSNPAVVTERKVGLEMKKASDKKEYQPGSVAHYSLLIQQSKYKDSVAKDVIIKDKLNTNLATIQKDTIKVFDNQNQDITDQVDIVLKDNEFTITTHQDLKYQEKIKVTYDVLLSNDIKENTTILNQSTTTCSNGDPGLSDNTIETKIAVAPAKEKAPQAVKTGDEVNPLLYIIIIISSLSIITVSIFKKHHN